MNVGMHAETQSCWNYDWAVRVIHTVMHATLGISHALPTKYLPSYLPLFLASFGTCMPVSMLLQVAMKQRAQM